MMITRGQLRRIVKEEARRLREGDGQDSDMVARLLNEAIDLVERASQLAIKGALERAQADQLERINDQLRAFTGRLTGSSAADYE